MHTVGFRLGLLALLVAVGTGTPVAGQSLTQTVTLVTPVDTHPYQWSGPVTVTAAGLFTGQGRYAPGGAPPATILLPLTVAGQAVSWTGTVAFTRTGLLTGTGHYASPVSVTVTQPMAIPVTMDEQPYAWEGSITVTAAGLLTGTGQLRPLGPGSLDLVVPIGGGTWAGRITFTPDGRVTGAGTLTGVTLPAPLPVPPPVLLPPANLRIAWLAMSPASVVGGQPATVTIVLNQVTPVDLPLVMRSSLPLVATVPAGVVVPAGKSGLVVPVTTFGVTAITTVGISAVYAGFAPGASLLVRP